MGIFGDLFSTKPAEDAAKAKIAGINTGISTANTALDTGLSAATPLFQQGYGDFSKLATKFGAGQDLYNDATGVNGADAATKAAGIYRTIPGYSAGRDMGLNDLERRAAARGNLAGGNTSADTIKFASDYDSTKYKDFLSSLLPNLSGAVSSTAGGAGVLNNEATANLGVAGQKAGIGYSGNAAIGDANAEAEKAKYGASQNFWSALMGGAKILGGSIFGGNGMPGFGGGSGSAGGATGGATSGPITLGGPSGPVPFY